MKTFGANAIAETFERDRGVVVRALRSVTPDAVVSGRPQWKISTASRALERHNQKSASTSGTVDPEMSRVYSEFDATFDRLVASPTLATRRAMAVKVLAPMIANMDRKFREHGRAIGAGDELTDLRADQIWRLVMRGFEAPCEWTELEVREALDTTAD
jgi:hypothetical protein